MSIDGTISEIRYLRKSQLEQEAKIIANYYRDIIHHRGIDCTYFRQDTGFPSVINPSLSAYEDIIYGENTSISYSTSSDMVVFMEVENDIFATNGTGTMPDQHYIVSFMIDDYASKFAYLLGGQDEFKTELSLSGDVSNYMVSLSGEFSIEGLSGYVSYDFDISGSDGVSGHYVPNITYYNYSDYERTIPVNPYIVSSPEYTISNGLGITAFIGSFGTDLDVSGAGTITSSVSGSMLYASMNSINRYRDKIRPLVGDIIRIEFPTEYDNFEEYELTTVNDRQLSDGGLNPLLHKYIYKCDVVRRIPDNETLIGDTQMEHDATDLYDAILKVQHGRELISNGIDDYSDGADDVYGGYGSDEDEIPDAEEYTDGSVVDVLQTIFEFGGSGSSIYTNGYDLFYLNNMSDVTKITLFSSEGSGTDIPVELMYMKSDGYDLYFQNKDGELGRLTNNQTMDTSNITQIPLSTPLTDFDEENSDGDMFYKFKSSKMVIFSDGLNLYTQNIDGVVTQLSDN